MKACWSLTTSIEMATALQFPEPTSVSSIPRPTRSSPPMSSTTAGTFALQRSTPTATRTSGRPCHRPWIARSAGPGRSALCASYTRGLSVRFERADRWAAYWQPDFCLKAVPSQNLVEAQSSDCGDRELIVAAVVRRICLRLFGEVMLSSWVLSLSQGESARPSSSKNFAPRSPLVAQTKGQANVAVTGAWSGTIDASRGLSPTLGASALRISIVGTCLRSFTLGISPSLTRI